MTRAFYPSSRGLCKLLPSSLSTINSATLCSPPHHVGEGSAHFPRHYQCPLPHGGQEAAVLEKGRHPSLLTPLLSVPPHHPFCLSLPRWILVNHVALSLPAFRPFSLRLYPKVPSLSSGRNQRSLAPLPCILLVSQPSTQSKSYKDGVSTLPG